MLVDVVYIEQNRLGILNLFFKGKVIWGEIQNNYVYLILNVNI